MPDVQAMPGTPEPAAPGSPPGRRGPGGLALVAVLLVLGVAGAIVWWVTVTPPEDRTVGTTPVPAEAHPPALAETMGEEGTLRIEVLSLDRLSESTVELRMAVTHVGADGVALDVAQRFSADGPDRGTLSEVYLADLGHQRKLFILRDADGVPLGSRDERPLEPAERRVVWARYPAPGTDDTAVVVHVPHAEPMPNVPIGGSGREAAPEGP